MSRRKFEPAEKTSSQPSTPQEGYWARMLRAQNLVGTISEDLEENTMQEQIQASKEPAALHPDMQEWAHRVAEALVPLDKTVTAPEDRRIQIQKRQQIRIELIDVLTGKTNFNEWFDKTKTRFSIRLPEYVQIFYESLEGLQSQEARELRQQYSEWRERVNQQYTPR